MKTSGPIASSLRISLWLRCDERAILRLVKAARSKVPSFGTLDPVVHEDTEGVLHTSDPSWALVTVRGYEIVRHSGMCSKLE